MADELKTNSFSITQSQYAELYALRERPPSRLYAIYFAICIGWTALDVVAVIFALRSDWFLHISYRWPFPVLLIAMPALVVLIALPVVYLARRWLVRAFLNWNAERSLPVQHQTEATLSQKGLKIVSPLSTGWADWRAIRSIKRGKEGLYIFISPSQAFVIPHTAFSSNEDRTNFEAQADAFWRGARQN